jgi:hypothetical protein
MKKLTNEEIKSLNGAVTILDDSTNSAAASFYAHSEMTPEQEKQMLEEAITLLSSDYDPSNKK